MGELWEKWWPTIIGVLLLAGAALLLWPRGGQEKLAAERPAPTAQTAPAPAPGAQTSERNADPNRQRQLEEARLRAALRAAEEQPGQSSVQRRPAEDESVEDSEPVRPMQLTQRSPEVRSALSQVEVELYETRWCKYCKRTRAFLDQSGVRYRAYDVEADSLAKARKDDLAPSAGVPVLVIDEQVLVGFSEAGMNAAFQAAVGRRLAAR